MAVTLAHDTEDQRAQALIVLSRVLARAARALGEAGQPQLASRLTAEGWAALRNAHPGGAERLTGTLHYLARLSPAVHEAAAPAEEVPMSESGPNETASSERVLDVRPEPPARRHELIFSTWQALGSGEAFVLVNDHDPKPLYYQFAAEHAGEFSWDYLAEGPEVWQVRIGRAA